MQNKNFPLSPAERKARQRDKMRAWILKQTDGKITTAEGYVMYLMHNKKDKRNEKRYL